MDPGGSRRAVRAALLLGSALAAGLGPAGARAEGELPIFACPPGQVLGPRRMAAVTPLIVSDAFLVDAVDRAALEDQLVRQLGEAGLTVVPPRDVRPLVEGLERVGDYLDGAGKFDERRFRAMLRASLTAVERRFGVDRLMVVGLIVKELTATDGVAAWHGIEEPAIAPVVPEDDEVRTKTHKVRGLSVAVWVHAADGAALYHNAGGVRLVERVGPDGKVVPIPDADLLADADRNARAVRIALAPMLEGASAAPPTRTAPGRTRVRRSK